MASFTHIDYSEELARIRDAFESIKDDFIEINNDFEIIKEDIATIKELGTNCDQGINTTSAFNAYSRALAMTSVLDEGQLQSLKDELENPTEIPEASE